jgi:NifU-like protein involved in Fe-S cluster formation
MSSSVADRLANPRHAAPLAGAVSVGEAAGGNRLVVRIGLWRDGQRVVRARYRSTTCASLIAYAEAACELLETGMPPEALSSELLRGQVTGVHPLHRDRADLVAAAARAAAGIGS